MSNYYNVHVNNLEGNHEKVTCSNCGKVYNGKYYSKCPFCSIEHELDLGFCTNCGVKITDADAVFCTNCGHPLSEGDVVEVDDSDNLIEEEYSHPFEEYQIQINTLEKTFNHKQLKAKELVAKRFEPPQLTYDSYISDVNQYKDNFMHHLDSVNVLIEFCEDYSKEIEAEIKLNICELEKILAEINAFINEFILSISRSWSTSDSEVDELIDELKHKRDDLKNF